MKLAIDKRTVLENRETMDSSRLDRTFLYIAATAANFVSFICGTAIGWTSPEIPHLKTLASSPLDHVITATEEGWLGSFLPLAAIVGPIAGGVLVNMIGRKKTLLIATFPFVLAYIINIFAFSITMFYVARFLCGLGAGIIFTVLPMYVAEISDDEVRGSLGSLFQLFVIFGLFFSYTLGPYLSIETFNIVLLCPPVICIIIFGLFIPDSPYYLLQIGQTEKALAALSKLRGKEKTAVEKEIEIIKVQLEEDQKNKGSFKLILKSKGLRTALLLSFGLVTFQQICGVNVVFYYTQSIFTDAGVSLAPEICTIIIGVIQISASVVSLFIVEKSGKRLLLITSGLGMAISLGVLAYYFYLKDQQLNDVSSLSWLPIASLVSFTIAYCLGFGPLAFATVGELFPGNVRPIASAATASCCWVFCFLTVNYFGALAELLGKYACFGVFSGCSILGAIFVFKWVPETTGMSLNDIQLMLSEGKKKGDTENIDRK